MPETPNESPTPSRASLGHDDVLTVRLKQEWADWCTRHHINSKPGQVRHDRYAAHGMPPGWVEMSRHPYSPNTEMALVSYLYGHWVLLVSFHADDHTVDTGVMKAFASVSEMYDYAVESAEMRRALRASDAGQAQASLDWVRRLLSGMYDSGDPVEAAEQMLVGLGGRPTLTPRTALQREPAASSPFPTH